ncbi:MAG TPA: hypothetical protein EYQ42_04445 [Thiotrichaceae bacterium]|jgi:hypothetical protein|nr:hypothetical protein [Thiotrichaceae bacterium]
MIKKNTIFYVLFLLPANINYVFADQCPTAEIIKERKISRDYEWTIDERRSLNDVLSVEKLYSVRIKNKGEFIACYYSGSKKLLRLDGIYFDKECLLNKKSGNWVVSESGEQICREEDLSLCLYEINCDVSNKHMINVK